MRPAVLALATVLLAAVSGAGCSWVAVRPPPDRLLPGEQPDCTTSREAPAADANLAALSWAVTLTPLVCPGKDCRGSLAWATAAASAGLGLYAALSARYGFRQTRKCRELVEELRGQGASRR